MAAIMVGLYFNLFLGLFLSSMHTYLLLNNSTTWELHKRDSISYLKHLDPQQYPHPFSQGSCYNLGLCFKASTASPNRWDLPHEQ